MSHYPKEVPWEVPEGWEWSTLGEVCSKVVDGDHNPPPSEPTPTEYLMISSKNVLDSCLDELKEVRYLSRSVFEECNKRTRLMRGDILLTTVGTLGRSCIYDGNRKLVLQRSVSVLTPLVLSEYIKCFFDSGHFQRHIDNNARGTAQKGFYLNLLESTMLPIPPLNEQRLIVAKASSLLSELNRLDNENSILQDRISQAKSRILDLAIHGKLVPQDPSDEPAIELIKRVNPDFVPSDNLHYEGIVPAGWQLCQLSDLFKITMGQSPDGSSLNHKSGIEFHQGKICFTEKYLTESGIFTSCPTKCAEPNSLLCCVRAPVGVFNITTRRICIGRGLCSLSPLDLDVDIEYWFYALCSLTEYYEGKATGSTFKAISGDIIRNTVIAVPPKMEQKRIREQITRLFSVLKEVADTI